MQTCFDSIYGNLLTMARRAGATEPTQHPSESIMFAGAAAAGLDDESLEELIELYNAVAEFRFKPGTHPVNLLHALALARHIAELVKR